MPHRVLRELRGVGFGVASFAILLLVALLVPGIGAAQAATDSAAAVGQRFLDAVAEQSWAEAARLSSTSSSGSPERVARRQP